MGNRQCMSTSLRSVHSLWMFLLQLLVAFQYATTAIDTVDIVAKSSQEYFGYTGFEWIHRFDSALWLGGGEACFRAVEEGPSDYAPCSFAWRLLMVHLELKYINVAFCSSGGVFLLIFR